MTRLCISERVQLRGKTATFFFLHWVTKQFFEPINIVKRNNTLLFDYNVVYCRIKDISIPGRMCFDRNLTLSSRVRPIRYIISRHQGNLLLHKIGIHF